MRLWLLLHEPRVVTAAQVLVWLFWVALGAGALLSPPALAHEELTATAATVWGLLLLVGGTLGLVGCAPGWWWVERVGIVLTATGATVWLTVLWWSPPSVDFGTQVTYGGFVVLALGSLVVRWLRIQGPALDPLRKPRERGARGVGR